MTSTVGKKSDPIDQNINVPTVLNKVIIWNLPTEYTLDEIKEFLFDDKEKENVVGLYFFKGGKQFVTRKVKNEKSVVVIEFNKDVEINDIISRYNGLKIEDDCVLRTEKFIPKVRRRANVNEGKTHQPPTLGESEQKENKNKNNNVEENKENKKTYNTVEKKNKSVKELATDTIIVKNIPFDLVDEEKIANHFQVKKENVSIPLRNCIDLFEGTYFKLNDLNCGMAFIKFENCENIEAIANKFDKTQFDDREIKVNVAYKKLPTRQMRKYKKKM